MHFYCHCRVLHDGSVQLDVKIYTCSKHVYLCLELPELILHNYTLQLLMLTSVTYNENFPLIFLSAVTINLITNNVCEEVDSCLVGETIPCLLWNPKSHYHHHFMHYEETGCGHLAAIPEVEKHLIYYYLQK